MRIKGITKQELLDETFFARLDLRIRVISGLLEHAEKLSLFTTFGDMGEKKVESLLKEIEKQHKHLFVEFEIADQNLIEQQRKIEHLFKKYSDDTNN